MHPTALQNCKAFFDSYAAEATQICERPAIVEIGSQDINGSLRSVTPPGFTYVGVDFVPGKGVDVLLSDPYALPFETNSADIVLASSVFEHSEMFWLLFLEIMRILKTTGLFYLNVPSNGVFHRYPVDCWRFYPDSGMALTNWARRNQIPALLLESYTCAQGGFTGGPQEDLWNDFVAVFLKDETHQARYPRRILHDKREIYNGVVTGQDVFLNYAEQPQDQMRLNAIHQAFYRG
ncbi:MAG: methyltransferase domain-containing protein [Alphaproteobacteria bacterium]|nr:methyltransferase domain-containing protein [Alphaproteobacteria bacterium]